MQWRVLLNLIKLAICKKICKTAGFTWIFTAFLNLLMFISLVFFFKEKKLLEYLLYSWCVGAALSNGSGGFLTPSDDALQHTHTIAVVSSLFPSNSITVLVAVSPSLFIYFLLPT